MAPRPRPIRGRRPPLGPAVAEANRRLAELGWPVVVEAEPDGGRVLLLRYVGVREARAPDERARLELRSAQPRAAADAVVAEVRRRGWDARPRPTLRSPRSSVWCDPA